MDMMDEIEKEKIRNQLDDLYKKQIEETKQFYRGFLVGSLIFGILFIIIELVYFIL